MAVKDSYIELRVTLRSLVETGLFDLGGHEATRGSAENRLASQCPTSGHSSNRRHGESKVCLSMETKEGLATG